MAKNNLWETEVTNLFKPYCHGHCVKIADVGFMRKPYDHYGCLHDGRFLAIEAKMIHPNKDGYQSFAFKQVRPHQRYWLTRVADNGGVALLALNMRGDYTKSGKLTKRGMGDAYLFPWGVWLAFEYDVLMGVKGSVRREELAEGFRDYQLKRVARYDRYGKPERLWVIPRELEQLLGLDLAVVVESYKETGSRMVSLSYGQYPRKGHIDYYVGRGNRLVGWESDKLNVERPDAGTEVEIDNRRYRVTGSVLDGNNTSVYVEEL